MSLMDVANELVAGCRENREGANLDKLYAKDAVSVEAMEMPDTGMGREAQGLDAIKGKHEWWNNSMEMLEGTISDPMPHGDDKFAVIFKMKVKEKASGDVMDMEEVGVYTVKDSKITREEFFYSMDEC
ncbi:nuclear transport factor 2 family protein [Roseovarius phycicola]|uniref:Nuclear transport factor 2 family protein n=1 Tax=Roseovarius phycicola TaxID=3080976 RepID=A0ABZ2HCQ9_9RHOB